MLQVLQEREWVPGHQVQVSCDLCIQHEVEQPTQEIIQEYITIAHYWQNA